MAGLASTITVKMERRPCTYKGGQYMFHKWFQEGGFERYNSNDTMEGSIDNGAILEDADGNVVKIWDITEIRFTNTETTNLCDTCDKGFAECTGSNTVFGDGPGNDNVVLCRQYKEV